MSGLTIDIFSTLDFGTCAFLITKPKTRVDPASYPKIFAPLSPALYVIETRSGLLDSLGVAAGDTVGIQ
jgi:hypothetical protein